MAKKADKYDNYRTFDEFVKNVKIPERKWKFFQNFIAEQEQTFGNAVKSYHAAGYAETSTSKYRARDLYNSAMMQQLLTLYHQKTAQKRENRDISVFDRVDNDLIWCIDRAKTSGDYQAVRAASMDRAKLHGQLVDRHQVIDPVASLEIDKTKKLEASKMAERMLAQAPEQSPDDVLEAEFEPVQETDSPAEMSNSEIESAILGNKAG